MKKTFWQRVIDQRFRRKLTLNLAHRCRIIGIGISKGGVAKTTSIVSLAAIFAAMGHKVLVIDTDEQGAATKFLGGGKRFEWEYTMADVIEGYCTIDMAMVKSDSFAESEGVIYFIGSDKRNEVFMRKHSEDDKNMLLLKKKLDKLRERFDFILIDVPPGLGFWNLSGLYAADYVIAPLTPGVMELESFSKTNLIVSKIKQSHNPKLEILGAYLVMPMVQSNVYKEIKLAFSQRPDLLFQTEIPTDTKIKEAIGHGLPITLYAPSSSGAKCYRTLAEEVLERCQQKELQA